MNFYYNRPNIHKKSKTGNIYKKLLNVIFFCFCAEINQQHIKDNLLRKSLHCTHTDVTHLSRG